MKWLFLEYVELLWTSQISNTSHINFIADFFLYDSKITCFETEKSQGFRPLQKVSLMSWVMR